MPNYNPNPNYALNALTLTLCPNYPNYALNALLCPNPNPNPNPIMNPAP